MIDDQFFDHEDPYDGSEVDSRAVNFGYNFQSIGENLAAGHGSVEEVMAHWMSSTHHRDNILDPAFQDIGISVKVGGEFGVYWVQQFGCPLASPPPPIGKPETGGLESPTPIPSTKPSAGEAASKSDSGAEEPKVEGNEES
jgi:hypothetical protein